MTPIQKIYLQESDSLWKCTIEELEDNKKWDSLENPKDKSNYYLAVNFKEQRRQAIIRKKQNPEPKQGLPKTERLPLPKNDKLKNDTGI